MMNTLDMDIMRPKLTRIGNMCFRRLDIPNDGVIDDYTHEDFGRQNNSFAEDISKEIVKIESPIEGTDESKLKSIDTLEADNETADDIEDVSDGKGKRFRADLEIAKYYHKFIIGQKGRQIHEIRDQSRCHIEVPSPTNHTNALTITGHTLTDVKYAINKIRSIVRKARNISDFTHFLSIPFNDSSIKERFNEFKKQVLQLNQDIDELLFQNSSKLHLTIVPILLVDNEEKKLAEEVLNKSYDKYIKEVLKGKPLSVKLQGVDYMNDDPTQVNVVYAKVIDMSEDKCLQSICDYLYTRFEESGLLKDRYERPSSESRVKLHVTLMNTSFLNSNDNTIKSNVRSQQKRYFDATSIIIQFKDYLFGQIDVQTIEISVRFSHLGRDG